jgi:hypothetical protein
MLMVVALLLAGAPAQAASPRTDLVLSCDGCFALEVELDGAHLFAVGTLGSARLQGKQLSLDRNPRFTALTPGNHHLRVVHHASPLSSHVAFDGPISLRPGAEMRFDVEPSRIVERLPSLDAGPPVPPADATASLTVRADDGALCDVALDGQVVIHLQTERVVRARDLTAGLHRLEVRSLRGLVLRSGTLFLGAGEEATGGVHCQTGAYVSFSDPLAYRADPLP